MNIRVRREELDQFEQAAKRLGQTKGQFLRLAGRILAAQLIEELCDDAE